MEPIARDELFMAAAVGEYSGELPEPVTRLEFYWQKIAQRIDSGGSVYPESIDAAIEDYLNTHDADIVTEAELAETLEGKANASHTHTKSQITDLANATTSAAGLMSAADKTKLDEIQTGARANVQADWAQDDSTADDYILHKPDLSQLPKFSIKVVSDLPVSDISYATIYLVPITNSTSPDMYTEYIRVKGENGASDAWEVLGTQTVDLSDYVTTDALNNALANKANSAHTHTKAQITDLTIDSTPTENSTNPVTSGGVFAALNSSSHMNADLLLQGVSTDTTTARACNWAAYDVLIFAYGWYTNIRASMVIPTSYFRSIKETNSIQFFDPSGISSTHISCRYIRIFPSGNNAVVLHSGEAGVTMWVWGVRLG